MTSPSDRHGTHADNNDLDPHLRNAVDRIRGEAPPEQLLQRSMDRLRAIDPSIVERRTPWMSRRFTGFLALAAALCVVSVVVVWQVLQSGVTKNELVEQSRPPAPDSPPPSRFVSDVTSERTLWSYHSAAIQSPEAFMSLLEEHSDQSVFSGPESLQMGIPLVTREMTL